MRHCLLLSFALALPASVLAQELAVPPVRYPKVAAAGADANAFVPEGWAIDEQLKGDISGDGRDDLIVVIQEQDPSKRLRNEGLGSSLLDTNPRMLLVALGKGKGYVLAKENHTLIPRHEIPTMSDPFDEGGIEIKRGALVLSLQHFMNAGGWDAGPTRFTFRWKNNALQLIGYDRINIKRNTGDVSELSVNFLTGQVKESHGNISRDEPDVLRWHRLKRKTTPTIDQIGDWQSFDPEGWVNRVFG